MENMGMEQKSNGALVGSIIIIIILVIGGIYFWQSSMKKAVLPPPNANTSGTVQSGTSLESSANSIDLENVDKGL